MKFKEGKIIEKFRAKDGREVIIRYPKKSDLKQILEYHSKIILETEFSNRLAPFDFKDKNKWWNNKKLNEIKDRNLIWIFAVHDGKIIGDCCVVRDRSQVSSHTGTYGISILQKYTGAGLGKRMTQIVFDIAKKELKLEAIELNVYNDNKIAQKMYKKFGFRRVGVLPNWIKHRTKTKDKIIMYKVL